MYYLFCDQQGDCGESFEGAFKTIEAACSQYALGSVVAEPRGERIWIVRVGIQWFHPRFKASDEIRENLWEWLEIDMPLEDFYALPYVRTGEWRYMEFQHREKMVRDGRLVV